ncbi:unnamed protein product, partial [Polarella glacialis]
MSGCLPCCSELLATLSRRSVSRDGCSLASLEAELDLGIEALQEDVILKVLELLPASALARLRALGGGSLQARPVHLAALVSRHPALGSSLLASSAGLRAVHVREAELLSFAWCGAGGRLASGEDGWSTDLGSAVVGRRWPEPAPVSGRRRWMLELLRLDGLLAVGLADGRLQNNAFLGSDSNFRWLAFGWELGPRGFFEAVSSTPPVRSGRDLAVAKHTLALSPGREDRLLIECHGNDVMWAVFDGHRSHELSGHASKSFPSLVWNCRLWPSRPDETLRLALQECNERARRESLRGGSTAVIVASCGSHLWCCCAGDSRAVAGLVNGGVRRMSVDHTTEVATERDRVQAMGGRIEWGRLGGCLPMTRGLGNFDLEADGFACIPEVGCIPRWEVEFIVVASDGLW